MLVETLFITRARYLNNLRKKSVMPRIPLRMVSTTTLTG